jgi:hypothetical protein
VIVLDDHDSVTVCSPLILWSFRPLGCVFAGDIAADLEVALLTLLRIDLDRLRHILGD